MLINIIPIPHLGTEEKELSNVTVDRLTSLCPAWVNIVLIV